MMGETISRGGQHVCGFGLGANEDAHSWNETSDLLNAYSYTVNQISAAARCGDVFRRATPMVPPGEPGFASKYPGLNAWLDDFNNAYAQFMYVRDAAVQAKGDVWNNPAYYAWSEDPAFAAYGGNVYNALVDKFKPFSDLDLRLRVYSNPGGGFPANCLPAYPNMPQPTATDYSLEAYKAVDSMIKTGEGVADDALQALGRAMHTAGEKIKNFVSSPPVMLFGVAVLVASGAVIVSHVLPSKQEHA